jgi:uncharacterized protein YerC
MLDIDDAKQVRDLCLNAIESLTKALDTAKTVSDAETFEQIRKGVGISIGTIDTRLLSVLYELHPELDHLKGK